MALEKSRTGQEGRPHVNPKTIQHRQLLQPGPRVKKLRMKASPYQKLACAPSKRKADSATVDSSSASAHHESQQVTAGKPIQSIKALKVIHHRFSNGDWGEIQSSGTSDETATSDEGFQPSEDKDRGRATSRHLMYKKGAGQWKFTRNQLRKYDVEFDQDEKSIDHDHALRPRTKLNYYPDPQASDSTADEQASESHNSEAQRDPKAPLKIGEKHISDKHALSDHHVRTLSASEQLGLNMDPELRGLTWGSLPNDSHTNDFGANQFCRKPSLPYEHMTDDDFANTIQQESAKNPVSDFSIRSSTHLHQPPLVSMRDMLVDLYPRPKPPVEAPDVHGNQFAKTEGEQSNHSYATAINSSPVSPIATGKVWESRATRLARRRQQADLARSKLSTSTFPTTNNAAGVYSAASNTESGYYPAPSNTTGGYFSAQTNMPLEGTISTTPTNNDNTTTLTTAIPPRFRNQITYCLVCLRPVTPTDLEVADLRCSACPRTFHAHCLTYIPPRMNQNWRCSLCYKEAWLGYGELEAEREFETPALVERYRRRLLVAKTYAHGGGPDDVRFWFDVDMDGADESDQAVLVRMGVVNLYKLQSVTGAEVAPKVAQVEKVERWGIALGMALQEEEAKVEQLSKEVERLKLVLREREKDIAELESGL